VLFPSLLASAVSTVVFVWLSGAFFETMYHFPKYSPQLMDLFFAAPLGYELAVLVTNDSDLLSAIQIVQNDLGLKVGIFNPQKHPSKVLKNEAIFIRNLRRGILKAAQVPTTLTDAKGSFYMPGDWEDKSDGSS
jgi:hypothetical protein